MMLSVRAEGLRRLPRLVVIERVALTLGLVAFFVIGYFGVGLSTDPARALELATPLDHLIPFIPGSVWIYLWMLSGAFLPLFVVRCPVLFTRTLLAYALAIGVSLVVFAAFPVTSIRLRIDPAMLDQSRPSEWALSVIYALDPPYNLFPSLHLSIATLAAFSSWKAARRWGPVTFVGVALAGVSICTVKQHFLLDGLGGLALAAALNALILRSYQPPPGTTPAYSWRGPVAYLAVLALVYAGLFALFLWTA
jgi:membrane-associated phospholipid phosphatase